MPFNFIAEEEKPIDIEMKPRGHVEQIDSTFCNTDNPLCPNAKDEDIKRFERLNELIYLDNNATHPVLPEAIEACMNAMRIDGNPSSKHLAGRRARGILDAARKDIADALGLPDPSTIIFTSGGTEANNAVLKGFAAMLRKRKTPVITVSSIEHKSILSSIEYLKSCGIGMESNLGSIEVDKNGIVYMRSVSSAAKWSDFISVMSANNETGAIQPIDEIVDTVKGINPNVFVHSDISQSIGKAKLPNISRLDAATFSSHKFGGPIGIGGLYIKDRSKIMPIVHGGNQEYGMRAGTSNAPLAAGMAAAFRAISLDVIDSMGKMTNAMLNDIRKLGGAVITSAPLLSNTLPIIFEGVDANDLIGKLSAQGVFVSAGSACTSHSEEPSHVLKAMGFNDKDCRSIIRISIGRMTKNSHASSFIRILSEELRACKRLA